jgi:hypothetical protein
MVHHDTFELVARRKVACQRGHDGIVKGATGTLHQLNEDVVLRLEVVVDCLSFQPKTIGHQVEVRIVESALREKFFRHLENLFAPRLAPTSRSHGLRFWYQSHSRSSDPQSTEASGEPHHVPSRALTLPVHPKRLHTRLDAVPAAPPASKLRCRV